MGYFSENKKDVDNRGSRYGVYLTRTFGSGRSTKGWISKNTYLGKQ